MSDAMQQKLAISFRHLTPSETIRGLIEKRAGALERFSDRIIRCEVVVEAPQKRKGAGREVRVHVNLALAGPDISVTRTVAEGGVQRDLKLAVNRAFAAVEEELKDREVVGPAADQKPHPPHLHGEITELEPELGHGWLRADDGREVYFQRDSLTAGDWNRLAPGMRLRFREMQGEKGPYATAVAIVE